MKRGRALHLKLQSQCEAWNAAHAVGSDVEYLEDDRVTLTQTKTRSAAYVLSGHTAVIFLEGKSGCYALDRVRPK